MLTQCIQPRKTRALEWVCLIALVIWPQPGTAQLAITEVMALAAFDDRSLERSDFWELTNFGGEPVNLSGYRWGDEGLPTFADSALLPLPITGAEIKPGESIVFFRVRANVPDALAFRAWWGPEIPAECQIYGWSIRPGGIDDEEGGVKLWDPNGILLDEVSIRSAQRGISFTYDANFGSFTTLSATGIYGAFQAVIGGDVGSPGYHALPPVPIQTTIHPQSQTVDAGTDMVLKVRSIARPQPRFQWYFNDAPIEANISGGDGVPRLICFAGCGSTWTQIPSSSDLVLSNIQPAQAGMYRVRVFNGLDEWVSEPAVVVVNTNPTSIQIHCPELACSSGDGSTMSGLAVREGQPATFTVQFSGYPTPTFAWSFSADGIHFSPITGATNRSITLPAVSLGDQGIYRLLMANSQGMITADAQLKVRQPAALKITEAMPLDCALVGRDWWELTNIGDQPESVCGYRWDDSVSPLAIGQGATVGSQVILRPGESVIFLENQTPESFRRWWGESNLPPQLQFINYTANGLSSTGDAIYLWDPTTFDPATYINAVVFEAATAGASFWFDPDSFFPEAGKLSVEGGCGTFRSVENCDIGSPGWSRWSPSHLVSVRREGGVTTLTWRAQPGSRHRLQFARQLATGGAETSWNDLGTYSFSTVTCTATDAVPPTEPQRFYRLLRVDPAACTFPE